MWPARLLSLLQNLRRAQRSCAQVSSQSPASLLDGSARSGLGSLCPLIHSAPGFFLAKALCAQLWDCEAGLSLPGDLNQ